MEMMICDVRRAYFYAKATRDLYVELPPEDPCYGSGMLGKLNLCSYGTRDAAREWQETLSRHLEGLSFRRGRGFPSVYAHHQRNIRVLVHGDDYVAVGSSEALDWFQKELELAYEIKTQRIGAGKRKMQEGKVLNRIVRITHERGHRAGSLLNKSGLFSCPAVL